MSLALYSGNNAFLVSADKTFSDKVDQNSTRLQNLCPIIIFIQRLFLQTSKVLTIKKILKEKMKFSFVKWLYQAKLYVSKIFLVF